MMAPLTTARTCETDNLKPTFCLTSLAHKPSRCVTYPTSSITAVLRECFEKS
jgi:hypothetical protein